MVRPALLNVLEFLDAQVFLPGLLLLAIPGLAAVFVDVVSEFVAVHACQSSLLELL